MDEGMARGLIAMFSVVIPVLAAPRLGLVDAPYVCIHQSHHVREPVHAELSDDSQEAHATAKLDDLRAGLLHGLDHLGLIALRPESLLALYAAVVLGRSDQSPCRQGEGLVERDGLQLIRAPGVELVLLLQLGRQVGIACGGPFLPALTNDRVLQPVGPIDPLGNGEALGTHSRIPVVRGPVAVEILALADVVGLLGPHDDPVPHDGPDAAGMGVVGRTDEGEARVVAVLIAIDPLPIPLRIGVQRVVDANDRFQESIGRRREESAGRSRRTRQFQKTAPVHGLHGILS